VLSILGKLPEPCRLKRRQFPGPFGSRSRLRQNDIRKEMMRDGVDATDVESGEGGDVSGFSKRPSCRGSRGCEQRISKADIRSLSRNDKVHESEFL
jgi:hypothetical protein